MNIHYHKYINTFFVVVPMTLIMAVGSSILNKSYLKESWIIPLLKSWLILLPFAYIFALLIIPLAKRLTSWIFKK
ncbi:DUF2798 domain-containing protein [Pedobacter antarcticus]|uniref:DUF2798 domain-containing protein n=1 Tax=Pedobacter antarcticus TaxID=34086 RepID=UPI001C5A588F|nr:DUF2798 domain-containing protein [Pedobacter antarcticus]